MNHSATEKQQKSKDPMESTKTYCFVLSISKIIGSLIPSSVKYAEASLNSVILTAFLNVKITVFILTINVPPFHY